MKKQLKKYKKGDEVEAKILAIDVEKERISLGIKHLSPDYVEEKTEETATKNAETTSKSAKTKKAAGSEPENAGTTNLGALLKAKMDTSDKENKD